MTQLHAIYVPATAKVVAQCPFCRQDVEIVLSQHPSNACTSCNHCVVVVGTAHPAALVSKQIRNMPSIFTGGRISAHFASENLTIAEGRLVSVVAVWWD